jgi:hypothetical protein
MENYFNYFTEIEEHFQKHRGKATLLSPLDWSLIESFQEAGIPVETVLRAVDRVFEKFGKGKSKVRKINSLAYCTQAILAEYEHQKESAVGKGNQFETSRGTADRENIVQLLSRATDRLKEAINQLQSQPRPSPIEVLESITKSLQDIKKEVGALEHLDFENLELRLSALEDKILASLISTLSDDSLMGLRVSVNQEIGRHKRGLKSEHIALLERKLLNKKVFDLFGVPRLSLFYLPLN